MADAQPKALYTLDQFLEEDLDYLIVGGGTAGLVVAARLSEDASVKVGVLEAGAAHLNDPALILPSGWAGIIEHPEYDWGLKTSPQKHANNLAQSWPRGKGLGGSSGVNYLMYIRGQQSEYEEWKKITGYEDWGWEGLKPYFIKSEGFHGPRSSHEATYLEGDDTTYYQCQEANHGTSGPIRTSFPNWIPPSEKLWHRAAKSLNIGWQVPSDAWGGQNLGGFSNLCTIDRSSGSGTRSYATTGYFLPNSERPNLAVLTEARACKVLLEKDQSAVRAVGVEFLKDGQLHTKRVRREVILSAGVIFTPQILELSGIGDERRLQPLGIETYVNSPQVGEWLEDHPCSTTCWEVDEDMFTNNALTREDALNQALAEYASGKGGPLANPNGNTGFLSLKQIATEDELAAVRKAVEDATPETAQASAAAREMLLKRLFDPLAASIQFTLIPGGLDSSKAASQKELFASRAGVNAISVGVIQSHPFSRGSIHVTSKDIEQPPQIDPQYLAHPVDSLVIAIGLRTVNDIVSASPLKERLVRRLGPGPDVNMKDLKAMEKHVRGHVHTSYHPIGTAAMGTVVDDRLRVMGVKGLRVVDASIFPLHLSGNIVGPTYAVAEKAADIIKEDASVSHQ